MGSFCSKSTWCDKRMKKDNDESDDNKEIGPVTVIRSHLHPDGAFAHDRNSLLCKLEDHGSPAQIPSTPDECSVASTPTIPINKDGIESPTNVIPAQSISLMALWDRQRLPNTSSHTKSFENNLAKNYNNYNHQLQQQQQQQQPPAKETEISKSTVKETSAKNNSDHSQPQPQPQPHHQTKDSQQCKQSVNRDAKSSTQKSEDFSQKTTD